MARFVMIHRWLGHPEEGWLPWLRSELEKEGCEVVVPEMPDPEEPRIGPWTKAVAEAAGRIDRDVFFVGHSIGNQAILRFLEAEPLHAEIGGMVMVAPWVRLKSAAVEHPDDAAIAEPWIRTPIHWEAISGRSPHFTAVFSDDDYFVPVEDAKVFQQNLRAEIVIEHGLGHMSGDDGVRQLPSALEACLAMLEASRGRR